VELLLIPGDLSNRWDPTPARSTAGWPSGMAGEVGRSLSVVET
jgi:hypothetical protein